MSATNKYVRYTGRYSCKYRDSCRSFTPSEVHRHITECVTRHDALQIVHLHFSKLQKLCHFMLFS
jgi:hypothetical protein